jgi:hypothetical protein
VKRAMQEVRYWVWDTPIYYLTWPRRWWRRRQEIKLIRELKRKGLYEKCGYTYEGRWVKCGCDDWADDL